MDLFQPSAPKRRALAPNTDEEKEDESMSNDNNTYGAAGTGAVGRLRSFNRDAFTFTINQRFIISCGSYRPGSDSPENDILVLPDNVVDWWINKSTKRNLLANFGSETGSWGWRPLHGQVALHSVIPYTKSISQTNVETTTNNESPYVCIGRDPALTAIDSEQIRDRTPTTILAAGAYRCRSALWPDPFETLAHLETLGVGQKWTKNYNFTPPDGRPYQGLQPSAQYLTYMPFDSSDGGIISNLALAGENGVTAAPKFKGTSATIIFIPFLRDVTEGASPLSLRAAMTVETSLTVQMCWMNDSFVRMANAAITSDDANQLRAEQQLNIPRTTDGAEGETIVGKIRFGEWY